MSHVERIAGTLADIRAKDPAINAFTHVAEQRALARARQLDERKPAGLLAGVPFAVKNLFDLAGVVTLAGSRINAGNAPAAKDAYVVRQLEAAGAVCVGALNMDEYAYGFTTENSHYGPTRNPRNLDRIAGGSSGGSAAAVAARMVPLALGSDTNGSIRVPASYCGVWGLKPTFGRLSRAGAFPFAASLDHVGPLAATLPLLAAAYDAMQGADPSDPACAQRPAEPVSPKLKAGLSGLRLGLADGYFEEHCERNVFDLARRVAERVGAVARVEIPDAALGRAAAFVITAAEGAQLHLPSLRTRLEDFEPLIRDRLLAGALIPAAWYLKAQRMRRAYYRKVMAMFESVDVILAPATPRPAHRIGKESFTIRGHSFPARASAGLLTQPISAIGLPVVCAPAGEVDGMPVGLQVIAAPWREDHCFRAAKAIEDQSS